MGYLSSKTAAAAAATAKRFHSRILPRATPPDVSGNPHLHQCQQQWQQQWQRFQTSVSTRTRWTSSPSSSSTTMNNCHNNAMAGHGSHGIIRTNNTLPKTQPTQYRSHNTSTSTTAATSATAATAATAANFERNQFLQNLIALDQFANHSPSSYYFPFEVSSAIREAAFAAGASVDSTASGSNQSNPADRAAYENAVKETASFMLKVFSSPMNADHDPMSSDGAYTASTLELYDALVWGFNAPFLWKITQSEIQSLYSSNILQPQKRQSQGSVHHHHHCEIAVGTGLFLSKEVVESCKSITLMDLNENSLTSCERRILRSFESDEEGEGDEYKPPEVSKRIVDITASPESTENTEHTEHTENAENTELSSLKGKFQSVSANFLFHCLHGSSLHDKINAFRNCASLIHPTDGVFFGSTILGGTMSKEIHFRLKDIERFENELQLVEALSMDVSEKFNEWGVFGNSGDTYEDLERVLGEVFHEVDLKRVGNCGVWSARNPK